MPAPSGSKAHELSGPIPTSWARGGRRKPHAEGMHTSLSPSLTAVIEGMPTRGGEAWSGARLGTLELSLETRLPRMAHQNEFREDAGPISHARAPAAAPGRGSRAGGP